MITPDAFVAMRSAKAELVEMAIDVAIEEAGRSGKTTVEVVVKTDWIDGLEQALRAYRHAGWKITHYTSGSNVTLRFEVP